MHIFANFSATFSRNFFAFEIKKSREQKVAGTKSRGTKSPVELIVAQNFKTKSRGNLMSRQIRKQKIPGTKSREVAHYFCATISSRDFLFPRLFVPIRYSITSREDLLVCKIRKLNVPAKIPAIFSTRDICLPVMWDSTWWFTTPSPGISLHFPKIWWKSGKANIS